MKMMVPSGLDLVEANPSAEARVSDTLTESHARSVRARAELDLRKKVKNNVNNVFPHYSSRIAI